MTHASDPAAAPTPQTAADAQAAANDAAPETQAKDSPEQRIAALEAELAELKDRVLRAHAETENVRRRMEKERDDARAYAASKFAKDVLSVADNLRRALDSAPKSEDEGLKTLVAGVEVTERELISVFERHQIKRIDPLGQRFDANLHEAVVEIPDPTRPPGFVVQVMMPGYTIAGRLLRAAVVGVSKGGPAAGQSVDTQA